MLAYHKVRSSKNLSFALCGLFFLSSLGYAGDDGLAKSLTGFNYNETTFMKSLGIRFGGWSEIGFTGNVDDPKGGKNGAVTFNDGANEFNLHQAYGFIEHELDMQGDSWDIGFRADLLYGTDARFSSATNFDVSILDTDKRRQLVFPQAYVDIYMPIGNGIVAKIGHFYTIIGYEVVPAPDNFFFSHAYAMQYGEPFTHTGAMLSYAIDDNIVITGGVVTGWDANFKQPANFLGGVTYTTDDERTSLAASLITGDVETNGLNNDHNRTMYSIVLNHDLTDSLHYVLQHDMGIEEKTSLAHSAKWYGLNQYLLYDILHNLGAGLRMEWFRDEDGTRVNGVSDHFIGVTGGLNYTPISWLTIRPEIRYDRSVNNKAFNDGKDDDQILLSISGIFRF